MTTMSGTETNGSIAGAGCDKSSAKRTWKKSGVRWEASRANEELIHRILASPGQTVKKSLTSSVTRHSVGGKEFYIKTYSHGAIAPAKYFFKNPASRFEWRLAPRLLKLGIPVVPHLAHGERWSWRGLQESILITEGPLDFSPLKSVVPTPPVQAALGRFVRRLHECSVFHTDLHVSNLLYSVRTDQFCLVDLDNMQILPSLDRQQRMDNLAVLNRRWPLTHDFYQTYDISFLDFASEIAERTNRKHRSSIPKKLKLLFANGSLFATKEFGGLNWQVRLRPWNEKLEKILNQPDDFLATLPKLLKNGTRSTVGCADGFVLKRSNLTKPQNLFFDLFRASRARHAFRAARHLELLKIATPLSIAMAERRRFGFIVKSYFVMEEIPQAVSFSKLPGNRRASLERVAELIAKLHHEGFIHRDLRESNVLFRAESRPYIIDLDGLRYVKKTSDRCAAANLARLMQGAKGELKNVPVSHRLRFLKRYCQAREIENWRWWWNQIAKNLPETKLSK